MGKGSSKYTVVALALPALLLCSCGRSVQRNEALTILHGIDETVSASTYSFPTSFTESVAYSGSATGNFFISYVASDFYYHDSSNVKGTINSATYEQKTETYLFVDDGILYNVDAVKKTYSKTSENAIALFNALLLQKLDINAYSIPEVSQKTVANYPSTIANLLENEQKPTTSGGDGTTISDETYTTLDDTSIDLAFSLTETSQGESSVVKIFTSFLKNRIVEVDVTQTALSLKTSYTWDNAKSTKPDLTVYSSVNS